MRGRGMRVRGIGLLGRCCVIRVRLLGLLVRGDLCEYYFSKIMIVLNGTLGPQISNRIR